MWHNTEDKPIPTYGKHGKEFLLNLKYGKYFGHEHSKTGEIVTAVWDGIDECFFEKTTGLAIDKRDIVQWYEKEEKMEIPFNPLLRRK